MRSALLGSLSVPELAESKTADPIMEETNRARRLMAGSVRATALERQWLSRPPAFFHVKERKR